MLMQRPAGQTPEPVMTDHEPGDVATWWVDNDGTVYRLTVIAAGTGTILLAGHGEPKGTWWIAAHEVWDDSVTLSWDYVAEKLRLQPGDREGWTKLLQAATGWRVRP